MRVKTNGIEINCEIEGNGPWITLSHALACNLHMWDEQMADDAHGLFSAAVAKSWVTDKTGCRLKLSFLAR